MLQSFPKEMQNGFIILRTYKGQRHTRHMCVHVYISCLNLVGLFGAFWKDWAWTRVFGLDSSALSQHTHKKGTIFGWSVLDVKFLDGIAQSKINIIWITQVGILDRDFWTWVPCPKMMTSKHTSPFFLCALDCKCKSSPAFRGPKTWVRVQCFKNASFRSMWHWQAFKPIRFCKKWAFVLHMTPAGLCKFFCIP